MPTSTLPVETDLGGMNVDLNDLQLLGQELRVSEPQTEVDSLAKDQRDIGFGEGPGCSAIERRIGISEREPVIIRKCSASQSDGRDGDVRTLGEVA